MDKLLAGIGLVFIIVGLFVLRTAATALIIALCWNWLDVRSLFHASSLSFIHVVGLAVGVNAVISALRYSFTTTKQES